MTDKIRILIVDDLPETRDNVKKLLQFEPDVEVIGVAESGTQAIEKAREFTPDVILMDINMPGVDGIGASQTIMQSVPNAQIIIMSVQSEADYLRRAMLAGARDFLMKPFSGDELMAAIRRVYQTRPTVTRQVVAEAPAGGAAAAAEPGKQGQVIAFYSPKGGAGCTTLSINMAVALAKKGHKTILVDTSLQFGDISVSLNMRPKTTIIDLIDRVEELDQDLISSVALKHDSGVDVLLAPPKPEMADMVSAEKIEALLTQLRGMFDFVIVDTQSSLNDVALSVLDRADRIMLLILQTLPSLTGARRFFDLCREIGLDIVKTSLVVNRFSDKYGIAVRDISDALKKPVIVTVEMDDITSIAALNRGLALVTVNPRRSPVIGTLNKFADRIEAERAGEDADAEAADNTDTKSLLGRLFG